MSNVYVSCWFQAIRNSKEQISNVLSLILNCGMEEGFCQALVDDGQQAVAQLLQMSKNRPSSTAADITLSIGFLGPATRRQILSQWSYLTYYMFVQNAGRTGLLDELLSRNIITVWQKERIGVFGTLYRYSDFKWNKNVYIVYLFISHMSKLHYRCICYIK